MKKSQDSKEKMARIMVIQQSIKAVNEALSALGDGWALCPEKPQWVLKNHLWKISAEKRDLVKQLGKLGWVCTTVDSDGSSGWSWIDPSKEYTYHGMRVLGSKPRLVAGGVAIDVCRHPEEKNWPWTVQSFTTAMSNLKEVSSSVVA